MHGSQFNLRDLANAPSAAIKVPRLTSNRVSDERTVAEECAVALVYDGATVAVLMASPTALADLAVGFSLTEGIVRHVGEIEELNVIADCDGIELRMWLRADSGRSFKARQRRLVGPTGCGLCGIESSREAKRISAPVAPRYF
jgi:FdhD protein